jgi:LacI family transcriptional regulator
MSVVEIARQAGVSPATVSRVLNHNPRVHPKTAEQVRRVARLLDYNTEDVRRGPKRAATSVARMGRLSIMAVGEQQQQWFQIPVFAAVVAGITRAAREHGWQVQLDDVQSQDVGSLRQLESGADGVIAFAASTASPALIAAIRKRVPVVRVMGEELSNLDVDQVRPDHYAIGSLAHQYLASRGCTDLAFVTTKMEHEAFLLRATGFASAASRATGKMPLLLSAGSPDIHVFPGLPVMRLRDLDAVADAIAAATPRPMGLFVSRDVETIGLYPLLVRRGIVPGRDIKLVSCDNEVATLGLFNPTPATIDVGAEQIGQWAVTRLINRITRPDDPSVRMLVAPRLVESVSS